MSLKDFFDRLKNHYHHELPFVVYRKPNQTKVQTLLQKDSSLHITEYFTETGFVFSPFDNSQASLIIPKECSEHIVCEEFEVGVSTIQRAGKIHETSDKTAKQTHIDLVNRGKAFIEESNAQKIVLSRKEDVPLKDPDPLILFSRLLEKYPSAFVYCWYHPEIGLWLGATPETLVKIEGNKFSIMALAGTQKYEGTLDVTWRDKELQEQQYVTDYIVDRIKAVVQNIQLTKVQTVKAANLLHLKTKIWGTLKNTSFSLKDFLFHLHPTPAVCGLPKEKAKQFIIENENYNRSFYTGFLGELNFEETKSPRSGKRNIENKAYQSTSSSTQLYVNLRCMSMADSKASIYVGGGITSFSDAIEEWDETVAKAQVIKSVL